jgi:hypothetical protein
MNLGKRDFYSKAEEALKSKEYDYYGRKWPNHDRNR